MRIKNHAGILFAMALLALLILVLMFNIINLKEAYGKGPPPYYSRTTNMDKWTNPIPVLLVIDTVTALAISIYFYWIRRK